MKTLDPTLIPQPIRGVDAGHSLDVLARLVLEQVDGQANINKIKNICGLDEDLSRKILLDLAVKGLIELPVRQAPDPPGESTSGHAPKSQSQLEKEIDAIYSKLESSHFYELLGVAPDATRADIRSRYFELSKRFHPDKAFGQDTQSLRRKMGIVFRKLTEAYDTLSRGKSREQYDASIAGELELYGLEQKLKKAIEQRASNPEISPPKREALTPAEPQTRPPHNRPHSAAEDPSSPSAAAKAPAMADAADRQSCPAAAPVQCGVPRTSNPKTAGGANTVRASVSRTTVPPRPSNPAHDMRREQWRKERAGRAMAAILNRSSVSPPTQSRVKESLRDAELSIESERYGDALRLLTKIQSAEPENEKARQLIEKAQKGHAHKMAQSLVRKGLLSMRQNELSEAQASFKKALESDPSNIDAKHLLAETLIQQKRDLTRALSLMKEVVALGGNRARYFITFGDLVLMEGDVKRARDAYSRALEIEPDNKDIKKKLKACKK